LVTHDFICLAEQLTDQVLQCVDGDSLTIDRARHGTNPNESGDVGAIAQHRASKAHGLSQTVERCVFDIVTNASEPLISFASGDGGVIGLPHRTHQLHEDCASLS